MSLSRVLRTPKRFDSSSQSSSSSLLTSTPVTGLPILTNEPAQSPIEQKNSSQTIVTRARANPAYVRGRLDLSSLSLNESSNSRYRTRSQSRILDASSILDQSNTPKRISKLAELSVKIHKLVPPLKPKGKIGSENVLSNAKKTGAMFSIFSKPNAAPSLTRSRTEPSISVRGRARTRTVDRSDGSIRNTQKSIIDNKEKTNKKNQSKCISNKSLQEFINFTKKYPEDFDHVVINFLDLPGDSPKCKTVATSSILKKLSPDKMNSKIKVLRKQALESQISIKTQNKILPTPVINKNVPDNKKITVDLPAQSKEPALPQRKESDPSQRNKIEKEIITCKKIALPVNGKKLTRNSSISKKTAEAASKEKLITKNNNIASKSLIPEAVNSVTVSDDAYSNNNASGDSRDSVSTRISDDFCCNASSKPSFIRRKLYSRSSDYVDSDSTKQVDQSFLEKKDIRNLYSLNKKDATSKNIESVSSSSQDGEQPENADKAAENLRQYCLRKNVKNNYTKFFGDSESIIDCAIKDANNAKESTCKLVTNILKDINSRSVPKPPGDTDKDTAKDQAKSAKNGKANDEVSNKKTETINPDFDNSIFDIFTQKEKDTSKSPSKRKTKAKVSKAKPSEKKKIKPPVKKVLAVPKRRFREKPKHIESVKDETNLKILKKSTEALKKPATARHSLRSRKKSIIVEKTYSCVLRKSDQSLNYSEQDVTLSDIQTKDVMKRNRVSSKEIQKTLEISSTQRRIRVPHKERKELEGRDMLHRRKVLGSDHNQRHPLETFNNDTVVFRNGKLIPGSFGNKTSLSTQSFYNDISNIHSGAGLNVKLNYKTNFKDLYRGINDFDAFERYIHRSRETETPFFDRTAMNIARETRQHMEQNQYVFKNPSNVLWNPKPSLEYTVCVGNKYGHGNEDGLTNSTFSSSFRKQKQGPFDMYTKYGVERCISSSSKHGRAAPNNHNQLTFCFPTKGSSILKTTGQDLLEKTKTLNKMITTLPASTEERHVQTSQMTYGRDSRINKRVRNPCMMQFTINQPSHVDSYRREPLNTHGGLTVNLAKGVSEFGDFNDEQYQINKKQHTTTLSDPMRNHPQPSCGGTFADSFQIPMARSVYPISNSGRRENLYTFRENSEYRNFNVLEPKSRSTLPNPLRNPGLPSFGECASEFEDYEEDPFQIPIQKSRTTLANPLRKPLSHYRFGESVSEFGDFEDDLCRYPREGFRNTMLNPQRNTISNPQRNPTRCTIRDSESELRQLEEDNLFKIPAARSRETMPNPGKATRIPEFNYDEDELPTERPQNLFPSSSRQATQVGNYYTSQNHSRNPTRRTIGDSDSELRQWEEDNLFKIPAARSRETMPNPGKAIRIPEFNCDQNELPTERPRNLFPSSSRQATQVDNYYTSQNHSRNPTVFIEQHSTDYNESNGSKMPMDRSRKRKIINEEFNGTENELKKSRFEDSRFSTTSNIGSLTQISSFYSSKEKSSNGKSVSTSVVKSSSVLSPVKKITEKTTTTDNVAMMQNDHYNNLHGGNGESDDSRSNYFSDNEHEDTVISTNNYLSFNDKPKETVPTAEKQPTTAKESTGVVDKAANNKKYDICDDEISNIVSKKNDDHRNGDDDTFFFKGSYTTPITSGTANSICSSNPYSSTSHSSRIENSKISAGNTMRLNADFTKKYNLAAAVASTSSAQNKSSVRIQKSGPVLFDGEFKKPPLVDNRSPTPNTDDKISRVANCSPWRFSKW